MILFKYTILYVNDVLASMAFYEKAFGFQQKFISPDKMYGELATGNTTLSFAHKKLAASKLKNGFAESDLSKKPFGFEIAFTTDNVEATLQAASKAGGTIMEFPNTTSWGQVVAYVRDPDGFLVEICTPISAT